MSSNSPVLSDTYIEEPMAHSVSLPDLFHEDAVLFDVHASSRNDLIRQMAAVAIEKGFATEGYAEDVIQREDLYPTGLPTSVLKVAIPHAMVQDHVVVPAIVIARLATPVNFKEMGDGEVDVPIDMAFMLVAKGDAEYLAVLQKLICLFAEPTSMERIAGLHDARALVDAIVDLAANVVI